MSAAHPAPSLISCNPALAGQRGPLPHFAPLSSPHNAMMQTLQRLPCPSPPSLLNACAHGCMPLPTHVCLIPDPLQRPPFPSDSALQCCRPIAIVPPLSLALQPAHFSLPHCMTRCHALHQDATLYMVLLTFPLKPGRPSSYLRCPHLCGGKRNSQPLAHAFARPCLLNTFFPMCGPRPSFLTPFQIVPPCLPALLSASLLFSHSSLSASRIAQ